MSDDRQRRAEAVFREALAAAPADRVALVEERCRGDAGMLAEVRELLRFHEEDAGGMLDTPPLAAGGEDAPLLAPGVRFGRYQIERLLGEGGMGVVYVARQERPRRTVALKLIRPGFATPAVLRRFEHEAEVLGRLHHPGIAQIYEAGTAEAGRQPFFAMELVDGPPLLEFARGRPVRERLALLVKVCRAVEHAHQRGVIHRDLKPANILVDRSGEPKVLDFGVARAGPEHGATMQTREGQIIGTLAYMPPEQVAGDPSDVDTRADVYALGVILYQLLCDRLPHDLTGRHVAEIARVIRDEDPRPLSAWAPEHRGDLTTIAARAMAKDRRRRYQSAATLAEEIERHLAGRPIEARRDSTLYVLGRHIRRRWGIAFAGAAAILLLAAVAAASARQARVNRDLAESNGSLAQQMTIARDKAARLLETAQEAQARAELELTNSNLARARLLADRGDTESSLKLFWEEFLKRPERPLTRLALWGFYAGYPGASLHQAVRLEAQIAAPFPDGVRALLPAPADSGAKVQIYDAGELRTLATLDTAGGRITDAVVSSDGAVAAIGTYAGDVLLFDGEGRRLSTPEPLSIGHYVLATAISPDGAALVAAGLQRTLTAFDLKSGRKRAFVDLLNAPGNPVIGAMAFSRDGRLFTASWNGEVHEIDPATLETRRSAPPLGERLDTIQVSPDGSTIAVSTYYGDLIMIDAATLKPGARWKVGRLTGRGLQFLDGGRTVLTCGSAVALWDAATGVLQRTLGSNEDLFCSAAYLAKAGGSGRFISVGSTGTIRVTDRSPAGAIRTILAGPGSTGRPTFSRDGRLGVIGLNADRPAIVDMASGRIIARGPEPVGGATQAAFGPGDALYFPGEGGVLMLDLRTGETTMGRSIGDSAAFSLAVSPDLATLAVGDRDGVVHMLSLDGSHDARSVRVGTGAVLEVVFSADSSRLYALESAVSEISVATAETSPSPITGKGYRGLGLSPDGRWLAASMVRGAYLADLRNPQSPARSISANGSVSSFAFSPDSATLLMGYQDGAVRGWDLETGGLSVQLQDLMDRVTGLAISPDGRWLLMSGAAGRSAVRDLWALDTHLRNSTAWVRSLTAGKPQAEREAAAAALDALAASGAGRLFWGGGAAGQGPDPAVVASWGAATLDKRE